MSRAAKYIVFKTPTDEFPVVFPDHIDHSVIAQAIKNSQRVCAEPDSAGFAYIESDANGDTTIVARGQSITLSLQANEERDSFLLKQTFNLLPLV